MRFIIIYSIFCLCLGLPLHAQTLITGKVLDEQNQPLFGATVFWQHTNIGTQTDTAGNFSIPKQDTLAYLKISYIGYNPVLIDVAPQEDNLEITISGIVQLENVEIVARQRDYFVSTLETRNIEMLGQGEFKKAACCNLSESFETNAAVDVAYADAITGAKEIQLLGLRGLYTQMLLENRPSLGGLSTLYSLDYIPGTWLEGVQITKGSGSVINGYNSIAGQINIELVKPHLDKPFFLNLFANQAGRYEGNLHLNKKLNERWSVGTLLHSSTTQNQRDANHDRFKDELNKTQYNGMGRIFYESKAICSNLNIHALRDTREGGQLRSVSNPFIIATQTDRVEVFGKTGYMGFKEVYRSVGTQYHATWQDMALDYGTNRYRGSQRSAYLNLLYNTIMGTTDHKIVYGASFQYDELKERLNDVLTQRTERVPGVFTEYIWHHEPLKSTFYKKFGLIAGLRADYHNLFGLLVTPRLNAKLNFSDESVLRFSAGRGYRTANVFAENLSALISNKVIRLNEKLDIEDAWNVGMNYTYNFKIAGKEASLVSDAYYTRFTNQIVLDRETDIREIRFYNLNGLSDAANVIQSISYEVLKDLTLKVAYKWTQVRTTYTSGTIAPPLIPSHRGLITLDYKLPKWGWQFNSNIQLVGRQRLPDNRNVPLRYKVGFPEIAPAYALLNAQITKQFASNLEVYLGGENLSNYHQHEAIVGASEPYGNFFDATQVYAPIHDLRVYVGVRYHLPK